MVLEACVLCIDNSDFMRNGDFAPSRMEAQQDAVNLLSGTKCQSNPENSVGVLSMAGAGVTLHVALTGDVGKILSLSHGIAIGGEVNITAGIQVAQLALKHRQNKNQRQRIIVFVGSPIADAEAALVKLGKKLKKNSVAMDIVNFGEVRAAPLPRARFPFLSPRPSTPVPPARPTARPAHAPSQEAENASKLEALLNAVNSDDNSHLVTVPPGPHVLSDILLTSPIVQSEDGGGGGGGGAAGGGGGGGGGEFQEFAGVDPTLDPEFAWALRASMEEERARQEAEAKKRAEEGGDGEASATGESAPAAAADAPMGEAAAADEGELDEAALLEQAIAMSMPPAAAADLVTPAAAPPPETPDAPAGGHAPAPAKNAAPAAPTKAPAPADVAMGDAADEDEDAEMQLALAMSMSQEPVDAPAPAAAAGAAGASAAGGADNLAAVFQDQAFVQGILSSLPGVDPNDPAIQSVLKNLEKKDEGGEKKDDKK